VVLNGQALSGVTPLRVGNLLQRTYDVRVRLAGFKEQQVPVEVRSGVDQTLPRIALAAERVKVRITSEPSGGEAVLTRGAERRTLGRTPIDVTLENDGAAWNVEINKGGYEAYAQPITIEGGSAEQTVRAVLSRKSSADDTTPALATSEPPRSTSRASSSSEGSSSSSRESSSSSSRESSSASSRDTGSEGGSGQGTLRINSRPWSQVTIDGRSIGNTPQMNVALPSGNHRVTLVNPEFNLKKTLTITIKPGQTETQIISLQ
jgi:HSP20 family molecular chaperone IbpA